MSCPRRRCGGQRGWCESSGKKRPCLTHRRGTPAWRPTARLEATRGCQVVRRLGERDAEQRAHLRRVDRAKAPLIVGEVVQEHAFLFVPGKLGLETALERPEEHMHDAAPRVTIIEQPVAVIGLRHDVSNWRGTSPSTVLSDPEPHFGRGTCPSGLTASSPTRCRVTTGCRVAA